MSEVTFSERIVEICYGINLSGPNVFMLFKTIILDFEKQKSLHYTWPSISYYIYFTNRSIINLVILTIEITRCHKRSNLIKKHCVTILFEYMHIAISSIIWNLNMTWIKFHREKKCCKKIFLRARIWLLESHQKLTILANFKN